MVKKIDRTIQLSLQAVMTLVVIGYVIILLLGWMSPTTLGIETASFENVVANYWVGLYAMVAIIILYFAGIAE